MSWSGSIFPHSNISHVYNTYKVRLSIRYSISSPNFVPYFSSYRSKFATTKCTPPARLLPSQLKRCLVNTTDSLINSLIRSSLYVRDCFSYVTVSLAHMPSARVLFPGNNDMHPWKLIMQCGFRVLFVSVRPRKYKTAFFPTASQRRPSESQGSRVLTFAFPFGEVFEINVSNSPLRCI